MSPDLSVYFWLVQGVLSQTRITSLSDVVLVQEENMRCLLSAINARQWKLLPDSGEIAETGIDFQTTAGCR